MSEKPKLIIIAGPNGAGKSTSAPLLLRDMLAVDEFVNADTIAQGLCAFAPDMVALEAGKIMIKRLHDLANRRVSFAFETTLASRSFAPWARQLIVSGYRVHLLFLSLPSAEAAIERVQARVRLGGHSIPENVVRRRFTSGLQNLFQLYMPVVTTWKLYDNTVPANLVSIAEGTEGEQIKMVMKASYHRLEKEYANE